mgnify:CR=1 FL=1
MASVGINAGTVDAGFIPAALRHRAPLQTGIGVIIAALFPAVARTHPLAVGGTFVGAGSRAISSTANLAGGTVGMLPLGTTVGTRLADFVAATVAGTLVQSAFVGAFIGAQFVIIGYLASDNRV